MIANAERYLTTYDVCIQLSVAAFNRWEDTNDPRDVEEAVMFMSAADRVIELAGLEART
jgi:hypothetical protein